MSEKEEAYKLADRLLDVPNADPDDELRVLSRQLLRHKEWLEKMHEQLQAVDWNAAGTRDLVNANRDAVVEKLAEGLHRVKKEMDKPREGRLAAAMTDAIFCIVAIVDAALSFHPMHADSWCGWPKENT